MSQTLATAMCTYTIKPGKEADFEKILAKHWPALHKAGLTSTDRPMMYKGTHDRHSSHAGRTFYVEIFSWKDAKAPDTAHQMPEVMAVWEPMGALCEHMQFPHVERIELQA
jgi:hypothetical protein